jgi:O-acetyl-ADP-ribose deacetylase (regulator of RNase III)
MTIEIVKVCGNLITLEADFIVNASNTELILGSGVSMAFHRHCGNELQKEMNKAKDEILEKGSKILPGDVVATHSCNADNFKFALHAAVINYTKGTKQAERKPTLDTIKDILYNTIPYLEWYSRKTNEEIKIVFPYLGCGAGGLNKTDVFNLFDEFTNQHFELKCSIILCDYT